MDRNATSFPLMGPNSSEEVTTVNAPVPSLQKQKDLKSQTLQMLLNDELPMMAWPRWPCEEDYKISPCRDGSGNPLSAFENEEGGEESHARYFSRHRLNTLYHRTDATKIRKKHSNSQPSSQSSESVARMDRSACDKVESYFEYVSSCFSELKRIWLATIHPQSINYDAYTACLTDLVNAWDTAMAELPYDGKCNLGSQFCELASTAKSLTTAIKNKKSLEKHADVQNNMNVFCNRAINSVTWIQAYRTCFGGVQKYEPVRDGANGGSGLRLLGEYGHDYLGVPETSRK